MKKVIYKTVEIITGTKVHASHKAIKGKKSGGTRDTYTNDWKATNLGGEAANQN